MAGIDNVKLAVRFAVNLSEGIASKLDDKKLTALEALSLLPELFPLVDLIRNANVLWDELQDLTETELDEVYEYAQSEFDIPNDLVEEKVEKAIGVVVAIADFFLIGKEDVAG